MGLYLARQTFPEALLTRELSELQYFKTLSPLFFAGLYSYLAVQHGQPPNFIVIVGQRRRTQGHRTSERHAIPVVMTVVMAASHIAHIVVMSLGGPWATVPDWLQILGKCVANLRSHDLGRMLCRMMRRLSSLIRWRYIGI